MFEISIKGIVISNSLFKKLAYKMYITLKKSIV